MPDEHNILIHLGEHTTTSLARKLLVEAEITAHLDRFRGTFFAVNVTPEELARLDDLSPDLSYEIISS